MQSFLSALTPALREEVQTALQSPDGESRLRLVVGRYIDDQGRWPTDPSTAAYLGRQFVHTTDQFTGSPRYSGSGLTGATVAGLAGAGLALGGAKGATVLSSNLMANYWQETLAYSTGMSPVLIRSMKKVFDQVAEGTSFAQLSRDLTSDAGPSAFNMVFGDGYAKMLEKELLGGFARSAWRGMRSALNHSGMTIGDFSEENPWITSYVQRFSQNQANVSERTIRLVLNRSLERGEGSRAIGQHLERLWNLSPQHAQAVENYRDGLKRQEQTARTIRNLTRRYADRLRESRLKTIGQTEAHTAFNLGREAQWHKAVQAGELPLDTMKMWMTAKDELVCPVCRPLDGTTAELGEVFENTGLVVPTAHPNCRCIVVPVQGGTVVDMSRAKTLIFPVRETVEKHLGGSDGTDLHPSGTPQIIHSRATQDHEDIAEFLSQWKRPPMNYKTESGSMEGYNNYLKRTNRKLIQQLKSEFGDDLASSVLRGARTWTSKAGGVEFARAMSGESFYGEDSEKPPDQWRETQQRAMMDFLHVVRNAEPVNTRAFRGIHLVGVDHETTKRAHSPGAMMKLPLSSFASQQRRAELFTHPKVEGGMLNEGTRVIYSLAPGYRGINVSPLSTYRDESEIVTSGDFEITDVKEHTVSDLQFDPVNLKHDRVEVPAIKVMIRQKDDAVSKSDSEVLRQAEKLLSTSLPVDEKVEKHLGGPDGTDNHPSGTPQSIHRGYDAAIADMKEGAYDMPMSWLRNHVRGSGFRIGQRNRINNIANKLMKEGFTKPIVMWVYEDGPFIRDGMHRLEAANKIGLDRVPVAIHHVEGNKPKQDFRGLLAQRRLQRQMVDRKRETPFRSARQEKNFVRWFNNRMERRGAEIAEDPPKRRVQLTKSDAPVRWDEIDKHLIGQHDQQDHDPTKGKGHSRDDHAGWSEQFFEPTKTSRELSQVRRDAWHVANEQGYGPIKRQRAMAMAVQGHEKIKADEESKRRELSREENGFISHHLRENTFLSLATVGLAATFTRNPNMAREWMRFIDRSQRVVRVNPRMSQPWQDAFRRGSSSSDLGDAVRTMFEGNHGGFSSVVNNIHVDNQIVKVFGSVVDEAGGMAGTWSRTINRGGEVHHDLLDLLPSAQGSGFASGFYEQSINAYRASGFGSITTLANITVGGYAWARQGFQFAPGTSFIGRAEMSVRAAMAMRANNAYTWRDVAQAQALSLSPGTRPIDYTRIGRSRSWYDESGIEHWFGKDMMLGSNWFASKAL